MRWQRIEALPSTGELPRCALVVVASRTRAKKAKRKLYIEVLGTGLAYITKGGEFDERDISAIETRYEMDPGSGKVTHWIPLELPDKPQVADRLRRFVPPGHELIKHNEERYAVLSEERWGTCWLVGTKVPVSEFGPSMHNEMDCDADAFVWYDVLTCQLICLVGREKMAVKLPEY